MYRLIKCSIINKDTGNKLPGFVITQFVNLGVLEEKFLSDLCYGGLCSHTWPARQHRPRLRGQEAAEERVLEIFFC